MFSSSRDDSHRNLWPLYSASGRNGSQPLSRRFVDKFAGVGVGGEGGGEMREGCGRAGQRVGGAVLGSLWRWLEDWDGGSEAASKGVLRRVHRGPHVESGNGGEISGSSCPLTAQSCPASTRQPKEALPRPAGTRASKGGAHRKVCCHGLR